MSQNLPIDHWGIMIVVTCGLQSIARLNKYDKISILSKMWKWFFSPRRKWTFIGKFCFINLQWWQVVQVYGEWGNHTCIRWQCLQSTAFIWKKIVGKEKRVYTHAQDVRTRERAHTYALIICRRVEIWEISVMYSLQSVLHVIGVDQREIVQ